MPFIIPEAMIVYSMPGEQEKEQMIFLEADCPDNLKSMGEIVYAVVDGMVIRKGCFKTTLQGDIPALKIIWVEENIKGEKAPNIERIPLLKESQI